MIILSKDAGGAEDPACAVAAVAAALWHAPSHTAAATATLDAVRAQFGWQFGSYWLVSPHSGRLEYVADSGDVGEEFREVNAASSRACGEGPAGRAWETNDLVVVTDVTRVMGSARGRAAHRAGIVSAVVVPLSWEGRVVGTLDFFSTSLILASAQRTEALRAIGRLASRAVAPRL